MMAFIVGFLIFWAAAFNAFMDLSSEGKLRSKYWNKDQGWRYKYCISNGKFKKYEEKWYHFRFKPKYKEKFPFSTTIFVFLTDGWHLLQFLFHSCWQLSIAILIEDKWYHKLITFIVIKTIFSLIFEITYNEKKDKNEK